MITVSFTAKRSLRPFESDDVHVTLHRIPLGTSPREIDAMIAQSMTTADALKRAVYKRLGEVVIDVEGMDDDPGILANVYSRYDGCDVDARFMDGTEERGRLHVLDGESVSLDGVRIEVSALESVTLAPEEVADAQILESAELSREFDREGKSHPKGSQAAVPSAASSAASAPSTAEAIRPDSSASAKTHSPQPSSDDKPIPDADEIRVSADVFGIEIALPSAEDRELPITEENDESAGQLKTLNTLLSNFGYNRVRHEAVKTLLAEMGESTDFARLGRPSLKNLDKARAGMLLDWLYKVADEHPDETVTKALHYWDLAINALTGQAVLL